KGAVGGASLGFRPPVRAMRLLPPRLSHLLFDGEGVCLPPGKDQPGQAGGGREGGCAAGSVGADRSVPGLSGLRNRLSRPGALRPHPGSGQGGDRCGAGGGGDLGGAASRGDPPPPLSLSAEVAARRGAAVVVSAGRPPQPAAKCAISGEAGTGPLSLGNGAAPGGGAVSPDAAGKSPACPGAQKGEGGLFRRLHHG